MQELLRWLLDRLLALSPIIRVYEWRFAMLVAGGIIKRELAPGLHWRLPIYHELVTVPRYEQVIDLATAVVETSDGVPVAVSANMAYIVEDVVTSYRAVWDLEGSLTNLSLGCIASYIATQEHSKLKSRRGVLERSLIATINSAVARWGIRITRVHLTDCVKVRSYRHYVEGVSFAKSSDD